MVDIRRSIALYLRTRPSVHAPASASGLVAQRYVWLSRMIVKRTVGTRGAAIYCTQLSGSVASAADGTSPPPVHSGVQSSANTGGKIWPVWFGNGAVTGLPFFPTSGGQSQ